MLLDPRTLQSDPDKLEEIEKASLRLVTQALFDFRQGAAEIFQKEPDLAQDIAEDITREALDRMGVSRIDDRLYGKIDYKRARYLFHPEYAIRQALFVDSKAEAYRAEATATLQTAQTSLRIRHVRRGKHVDEHGTLPQVISTAKASYLTTTIFAKYNYDPDSPDQKLVNITVAALPNGMLQDRYNIDVHDTIWRAGRNAPSRGERFRVRLVFSALKNKKNWRVQRIPTASENFIWDD